MLDTQEAAALATLLEQLAARHPDDPLTNPARTAAAVLRNRITRTESGDAPEARRDAGDTRDTAARQRDTAAHQRDTAAHQRDIQARTASQDADTIERKLLDLLWDAEQRDIAAAHHAAATDPGTWQQQHQLDREMAASDRTLNHQSRRAIRDFLTQLRQTRLALQQDRHAAARDRQAALTDRQYAALDRRAAHTDRDQSLLDTQLTHPPAT